LRIAYNISANNFRRNFFGSLGATSIQGRKLFKGGNYLFIYFDDFVAAIVKFCSKRALFAIFFVFYDM
jgi:hypothetical protein